MTTSTISAEAIHRVKQFYQLNDVRESWPWRHWNAHPHVARAINRRITGVETAGFPQFLGTLLPRLGVTLPPFRTISLGCGRGRLDRELYRHGIVNELIGYDLSPDSLSFADHFAVAAGIEHFAYREADLNLLELEENSADLVVVSMALHHVVALEHLYEQIARTLKPHGLLIIDEYVGPTRFQWTEAQMRAINGLLSLLPPETRITPDGIVKPLVERLPESFFEQLDPSEAIRSAEVVPCLSARFEILWHCDYGGTILHPMLHDIAWAFKDGEPLSDTLLQMAIMLEDAMIAAGELSSDFAVIVARPR